MKTKAILLSFALALTAANMSQAHANDRLSDGFDNLKEKMSEMISINDEMISEVENGTMTKKDVFARLKEICSSVEDINARNEQRDRYVEIFPYDEKIVRDSNDSSNDISDLKKEYHKLLKDITLPYIEKNIEIPSDIYTYMVSVDNNTENSGFKSPEYHYCF